MSDVPKIILVEWIGTDAERENIGMFSIPRKCRDQDKIANNKYYPYGTSSTIDVGTMLSFKQILAGK